MCSVCGKFLHIRLTRMPATNGLLWLTLGHRSNRNVKTDPVCERCVVGAEPAAGFLDTFQNPARRLYFAEFITVKGLASSLSKLEALKF